MNPVLSFGLQILAIVASVLIAQRSGQKQDQERLVDAVTSALGDRIGKCEIKDEELEKKVHAIELDVKELRTEHQMRHPISKGLANV